MTVVVTTTLAAVFSTVTRAPGAVVCTVTVSICMLELEASEVGVYAIAVVLQVVVLVAWTGVEAAL